jgi:hypothetical protein
MSDNFNIENVYWQMNDNECNDNECNDNECNDNECKKSVILW